MLEKAKNIYNKMLHDPWWRAKKKYIKYYDTLDVDAHCILLESQHGRELNGNVFYMLRYLSGSEKYRDYKIYLSARAGKADSFRQMLDSCGMESVHVTVLSSDEYFRILASAKYLVNDNTFLPFFMKKEGQVYLNTWHGTPLKSLGRGIRNDAHAIGNAQRNFVDADYLLFPNEHTRDAIINDYMIANISDGSYIMAGYPRNEAFFDEARKAQILAEQDLVGKKVYAYMPTFRGVASQGGTSKNSCYMGYYLYELDKLLDEDEVFYVNLHPVAKKDVDFSQFVHIRKFPEEYETYEFLNAADLLVTDYSSVFFDFACTGRKIVLFTYDKEDYLIDRGMYLSMDEDLPFPQAVNLEELLAQLRSGKDYDDRAFLNRFCQYENASASQKLCDQVILGEDNGLQVHPVPNNGKENVLLYACNLAGNGMTASLRSLLNAADLEKRNYYFAFYTEKTRLNKDNIFTFPANASYYALTGEPNLTIWNLVLRKLYRMKILSADMYMKLQGKRVRQGFQRLVGHAKFDKIIQFTGYEEDVILAFSTFEGQKTIYVHSDMVQEMKTKGNQRRDVLHYAYNRYDNVAVVTDDMLEPTLEISGRGDNVHICRNLINDRIIREKGQREITFDPQTKTSVPQEEICRILASDSECFVNVGRFAPEKGHERLIEAFKQYHADHPDSYLFILGGYSLYGRYQKMVDLTVELGLQDHVILIENVSNPYPIVKACDYFVLSSYYEGFGLVLVEADILGLPVISTDIPGPRSFMQKYGGVMVEDSMEGILRGMEMLHAGQVKPMTVDYDAYNREAVDAFERMLEGKTAN